MTKVTLTVACHIDDLDDARNLAVCLGWLNGYAPDEWWGTFQSARLDSQGREWRVLCMPVATEFVQQIAVDAHLVRPEADMENQINMAGANRANDKKVIWSPIEPAQPVPQADLGKLICIVGMSGTAALNAMGLVPVPAET